jgi:hypothetical protein
MYVHNAHHVSLAALIAMVQRLATDAALPQQIAKH